MYRVAICDDEPLFLRSNRAAVASVLGEAGIAHEISEFSAAAGLESAILDRPDRFDVLLLDILMEEENGVELARGLRGAGFLGGIVFVTSTKAFSLEGYSVYPVQYLLKPLRRDALSEALLRDYARLRELPMLSVPVKGGHVTVPIANILYVESLLRTIIFHAKDQDIESGMTLRDALEALPKAAFVQCHRSYLVPLAQLRGMTRAQIQLKSGHILPVGRVFYECALSAFIEYMQDR